MSDHVRRYALALTFLSALAVALVSLRYLAVRDGAYPFEEQNAVYAAHRLALTVHVAASILALLAGPVQFLRGLRERRPAMHRAAGWLYVLAVGAGGVSGLVLAGHAFGPLSNRVAFTLLALLWLIATLAGLREIRAGNLLQHRRWMVRSYALAFSGVTLRAETLLFAVVGGVDFASAYGVAAWLCWTGNLVFAEWWILRWPPGKRAVCA